MSVDKDKDAGMALCLLCFLFGSGLHLRWLELTAMGVLFVDMIAPVVFRPFAVVWFGLSAGIGALGSSLVLSLLFFLVVTPVALVRRWMGKDSMNVRRWRRGRNTVFVERDHVFTRRDIERPY